MTNHKFMRFLAHHGEFNNVKGQRSKAESL